MGVAMELNEIIDDIYIHRKKLEQIGNVAFVGKPDLYLWCSPHYYTVFFQGKRQIFPGDETHLFVAL